MWPSADTQSRTTVCPSIQPSSPSLRTTMLSGCRGHGTTEGSTPTRFSGCFGCSAKEASGQAIAKPPISVMSFHRLILTPHGRGRGPPGYHFSDLIASHCCIAMGGLRRAGSWAGIAATRQTRLLYPWIPDELAALPTACRTWVSTSAAPPAPAAWALSDFIAARRPVSDPCWHRAKPGSSPSPSHTWFQIDKGHHGVFPTPSSRRPTPREAVRH